MYILIWGCCFIVGCTKDTRTTLDKENTSINETVTSEIAAPKQDDLNSWKGTYSFFEDYKADTGLYMFMEYNLNVYQENDGAYYADLMIDGQTTAIYLQAKVYGDEEWISLVYNKELEGNMFHRDKNEENSVLFSMRKEGDVIYTYWGDITAQLYDSNQISGKVYWEKIGD